MKNYKVRIREEKSEFFKELMKNLDFVEFEEVEAFNEPRVYPGANFELRSDQTEVSGRSTQPDREKRKPRVAASPEEEMQRLKDVMTRIDAIRDQNRK
jgi:hypothetical protein